MQNQAETRHKRTVRNQMRNDMTKSEQLEGDAERIRAHLAETVIELRARLTLGHAVDQLFDLSSDSAALEILRNLRDKTVANPLAVGIVGAGMAWLMYSRGREDLAQRRTFSGDVAKRGEDREEVKTQEQDEKIKSTSQDVLDEVQDNVQESTRSLSNQPSIVPSGIEGEIRGHRPSAHREPTGLPGGHD
jgi:hypothetical protein